MEERHREEVVLQAINSREMFPLPFTDLFYTFFNQIRKVNESIYVK